MKYFQRELFRFTVSGLLVIVLVGSSACVAADKPHWGVGYDGGMMSLYMPSTWSGSIYLPEWYKGVSVRYLSGADWEFILSGSPNWSFYDNYTRREESMVDTNRGFESMYRTGWVRMIAGRHLQSWQRLTCALDFGAIYQWRRSESSGLSLLNDETSVVVDTESRTDAWLVLVGLRPMIKVTNTLSLELGYWLGWIRERYKYTSLNYDVATQALVDGHASESSTSGWFTSSRWVTWRLSAVIWF